MSPPGPLAARVRAGEAAAVARAITLAARGGAEGRRLRAELAAPGPGTGGSRRIGVTGPPGIGKSTLIGALSRLYRERGVRVAVVACDPASPISGGAFLGDRMRMGGGGRPDPGLFIRSLASRRPGAELPEAAVAAAEVLEAAGFPRVILETTGAGQNDTGLGERVDTVVVVLGPEGGDEYQVLKAGLTECADILVVNRADRPGAAGLVRLLEEEVAGRKAGPGARVLATVATRGEGLPALLDAIEGRGGRRALPAGAAAEAER